MAFSFVRGFAVVPLARKDIKAVGASPTRCGSVVLMRF